MLLEFSLDGFSATFFCQAQGSSGIVNHLNRLDARQFIKEPSATGVHKECVPLHLEKLENGHLLVLIQLANGVIGKESAARFFRAVKNDADVIIAARPRISQVQFGLRLKNGSKAVPQPVEGGAQGSTPLLVPRMPAGVASAVAAPALNPVHAAP